MLNMISFITSIDHGSHYFQIITFCPRATLKALKGSKRSFVFVLLLLGVETWMKKVPNRIKIVQGNKKCASVAHHGIELPCLAYMALCGLVWPYVALYGLMWHLMVLTLLFTAMTMCGLIWISVALCVLVWPCMALYGLVWPCMALYGLVWSCMALNGIVFVWSLMAVYRLFLRS